MRKIRDPDLRFPHSAHKLEFSTMASYLEKARAIHAILTEPIPAPCSACDCPVFWKADKEQWLCAGCFPTNLETATMREVIWGIDGIPRNGSHAYHDHEPSPRKSLLMRKDITPRQLTRHPSPAF